ncbi:MAG: hypothetical protein ACOXZ6_04235 [Syntrophomonadaceae bacterium]|jgi:hypothetical protein
MKKILFVLVILSLVGFVAFAEEISSDDLTIYGKVSAPLVPVQLTVTPSTSLSSPIDLKGSAVKSTGAGVKVGEWKLEFEQHVGDGSESYTITYTHGDLESTGFESIEYLVYEQTGDHPLVAKEGEDNDTEVVVNNPGGSSVTKSVYIKLTEEYSDNVDQMPAADYDSTITIALTGN